jgi:hypothetical protein
MALKPKSTDNTQESPTTAAQKPPMTFRDNPEVKKLIEAHKSANPRDVEYYSRLVHEYPQRAIDSLIYKDVQKHQASMRLIEKQLPAARKFYQEQPEEIRKRIDQRLAEVNPYYKDKAFVNEVVSEMNFQNRRSLIPPNSSQKMAA